MPALLTLALCFAVSSDDWLGFRGPDGLGVHATAALPDHWSDEANLAWRAELPGPGASSPIVVDDRVFVTCWSGYGLDTQSPGDPSELRRHLFAFDRSDGSVIFEECVEPAAKEDPYEGRLATHGYASSTPVSDGERVYVFFGKRGVLAYDVEGNLEWEADVGLGSSEWNTGSAPSPVLCGDHVVVLASDESTCLFAFEKDSGEVAWKREDPALHLAFDTPLVVGNTLIVAMLEQVWSVDPSTGQTRFSVRTATNGSLAPSLVYDAGMLYSIGGQSGTRSYAIRLGGEGDVTESHIAWSNRNGSYVPSPVLVDGHLYWIDERGQAHCMRAEDGELIYRERTPCSAFYASVVQAGDFLIAVSREEGALVLPAEPRFEVLAHNRFELDESIFDGSPAVTDEQLFLRSNEALYCIEDLGD